MQKLKICFFFVALGFSTALFAQEKFTLSGYIADSSNGESLVGALAYVKGTSEGVASNVYGFYSLTLPKGEYEIVFRFVGYSQKMVKVTLDKNTTLNPKISSSSNSTLKEVVVTADQNDEELKSTQMSMIKIPIESIKAIPTIGGETDIIKVMQLMPGVKRGGEGQNGMFVRGGTGDDNLILIDEAVVYNVSHLFGFFSVFNNDALKDVTLIKGGFPAEYGGRLSSVMDIRMKEGDMEHFRVNGGIGLLSSKLTIQTPIIKDKMSLLVAGRRSYIDQVFKMVYGSNVLPYFFYDVNAKVNYKISEKDRIFFSTYLGDDVLESSDDEGFFGGGFNIGNSTFTARWNHLFNEKTFSNLTLLHTRFRYDIEASLANNKFLTRSNIKDYGVKYDIDYFKSPRSKFKTGISFVNHTFRPNIISTSGEISDFLRSQEGEKINSQEMGIYGGHELKLDSSFKLYGGLRLSLFTGKDFTYSGIEPRVSGNYSLSDNQSLKVSYSFMKQYMHLVSSASLALPTDLWYPATKKVKPRSSHQVAAGYSLNIKKWKSLFSVELYNKWLSNIIEYREGAVLLLNNNYEDELVNGKGNSYGAEIFLQKREGKLTGWLAYTLSWSTRQFDELNNGKKYFSRFDRRHDISLVGTYFFTKRFGVSAVWTFSSGQRFTPIIGSFLMPNSSLTNIDPLSVYSKRNELQLPSSHRFDINFILKTKNRKFWVDGEWHIGAYNVYNRAQPYRVEVVDNGNGSFKYQAAGLFGFIPSVAYNFNF